MSLVDLGILVVVTGWASGLDLLQNTNECQTTLTCKTVGYFHVGFAIRNDTGTPVATFHLEHSVGSLNPYIAVGFSPGGSMSPAPVTACLYTNPTVNTILTYNLGYDNSRISTLSLEASTLSNIEGAVINNIFACKWTQLAISPSNLDIVYDLVNNPYSLIFAYGTFQTGSLNLNQHNEKMMSEVITFNVSTATSCVNTEKPQIQPTNQPKSLGILVVPTWWILNLLTICLLILYK